MLSIYSYIFPLISQYYYISTPIFSGLNISITNMPVLLFHFRHFHHHSAVGFTCFWVGFYTFLYFSTFLLFPTFSLSQVFILVCLKVSHLSSSLFNTSQRAFLHWDIPDPETYFLVASSLFLLLSFSLPTIFFFYPFQHVHNLCFYPFSLSHGSFLSFQISYHITRIKTTWFLKNHHTFISFIHYL